MDTLLKNISAVYKRIAHAAMRAGRDPHDVTLVAVTKTVSADMIRHAMDAGLRVFGENRVQEAQRKVTSDELRVTSSIPPIVKGITPPAPPLGKGEMGGGVEWHLIGHLQRNKAKYAVQLFNLIHSIDSAGLAEEINKNAEKLGKVQNVLIEVKLSAEETKHGIPPEELDKLIATTGAMKNLNLVGLMTIPPFLENPGDARPFFRGLRELRDRAEAAGFHLPELSMGMSNDFEVAIEEGATMVRIGSAIFGERGKG